MRLIFVFLFSLFCSLSHCYAEPSIGIYTYPVQGAAPWDPESVKSGITGSEEAVIYISQKLVKLGYQVYVFGNPPVGSKHALPSANPRFVRYDYLNYPKLDVAISWRMTSEAKKLKKHADKVYLWPHDICCYKISAEEINGFDDVLWLSKWQREQWISQNPEFSKYDKIFGNGINPDQFKPVSQRQNPYACIYGSNYARGLDILLDIWPKIKQQFPKATLDIYYGWQHWGLLTREQEARMRLQIAKLASLDVHEHGQVSHEELNSAYERASLWTYPCTLPEVFCITAIRAQLSGAIPVIIESAALPETVRYGFKTDSREQYLETLKKAMSEIESVSLEDRKKMGDFILNEYTWEVIAKKWKKLFDE